MLRCVCVLVCSCPVAPAYCVLMCLFPLTHCRAVVFVVDSAAFQREVKDVAEFLYQVLIDSMGLKNAPSFLIACNKQGASWRRQWVGLGLLLRFSSFTCSCYCRTWGTGVFTN